MPDALPPQADATDGDSPETPIGALIGELKALAFDTRTLVEAEVAFEKQRLGVALRGGRSIGAMVLLALVLAYFALMALVFGLVLILAKYLGPIWATVIVTAALLVVAGGALMAALARWRATKRALAGEDKA